MFACLSDWNLSGNLKLFKNFWMRGNKMTFPFSGEFKFNLLKAKREDDMTSSTIKNLNRDLHLNYLKIFFCISICILRARNVGKYILSNRKERRNMTLKPTGILKVIWTLKLRGSFENYLQKKINLLGNFVKIIFSEVLFFAVEKCPSSIFYFSDNFSI